MLCNSLMPIADINCLKCGNTAKNAQGDTGQKIIPGALRSQTVPWPFHTTRDSDPWPACVLRCWPCGSCKIIRMCVDCRTQVRSTKFAVCALSHLRLNAPIGFRVCTRGFRVSTQPTCSKRSRDLLEMRVDVMSSGKLISWMGSHFMEEAAPFSAAERSSGSASSKFRA
jgi:hypothetical protein